MRTAMATQKSCCRGRNLKAQPVNRMLPIMKMLSTIGAAAGVAKCLWTLRIPASIATIQTKSMYGSIIDVKDSTSLVSPVVAKSFR